MEGRFLEKKIMVRPTCPFCGAPIDKPKDLSARMPNEMPVGSCSCGAVYAYDVTGHNLGAAMIEALVFGCNGDWDLAWGLLPEEDYLEKEVKNYDIESHLIIHGGAFRGRNISGTLYFIRLHDDIREVTEEGFQEQLKKATPVRESAPSRVRNKKTLLKGEVETLVSEYRIDALVEAAEQDNKIIRHLKRLLYSVDPLPRLKAADTLGRVSSVIARRDPGIISRLLQGFFTSIADTAASSWGALDAAGEIIRNSPEQYAGFIPQIYQLTRDSAMVSGVLRALVRIAEIKPDPIRKTAFRFMPFLQHPDPEVRGYTAMLLGNLKAREAKEDLAKLEGDQASLDLYEDGKLQRKTIGQLASDSLSKL